MSDTKVKHFEAWLNEHTDEQQEQILQYAYDHVLPRLKSKRLRINGLTAEAAEQREHDRQHVIDAFDVARDRYKLPTSIAAFQEGALFMERALKSGAYPDAIATPPAGVPDGWQPIETAPKDGTRIIGYPFFNGVCIAEYLSSGLVKTGWFVEELSQDGLGFDDVKLTHWMPLPAAPQPAAQPEDIPAIFKEQAS